MHVYTGEPSPPSNLSVTFPERGLGVSLMWLSGFALEGEEVTFPVTSVNLASGTAVEYRTRVPFIFLTPNEAVGDGKEARGCQPHRFTVHSENNFSHSIMGVSEETILPTGNMQLSRQLMNNSL